MPDKTGLQISELFYSLQGESTYAGLPCVFIRLSGCNLRCSYCDATYTYEEEGNFSTLDEIMSYVEKFPEAIVEVTGGEPLLQPEVIFLMADLLAAGRTVLLETNGSLDTSAVPSEVTIILDVKCPGSGMHDKMLPETIKNLGPKDEIKFVLCSNEDYKWAVDFIKFEKLTGSQKPKLLFSAVAEQLPHAKLAEWILADQLPVRLQLQFHKIIWPQSPRGV